MITQELLNYIKQQLGRGVSREEIKNSLLAQGWQEKNLDEAFFIVSNPSAKPVYSFASQNISALLAPTTLLANAWAIYKRRIATFIGVMVIPILIAFIISGLFIGGIFSFALISEIFKPADTTGWLIGGVILLLFFVALIITQIWSQTALIYAIKDSDENIGVIESYRRGWRKIVSYFWVSLLEGIITLSGFLLLLIPGIIFSVWFSFAGFILIAEDIGGMNALLKSREYVRGKWMGVFWRFLFIGLVYLVIYILLGILEVFSPSLASISNITVSLILTPLAMIYSFLIYTNLKALKGEFTFAPALKTKAFYIFISVLAFLYLLAIIFFLMHR